MKININRSTIKNFLVWLGFFNGFINPIGFISYIVGITVFFTKFKIQEVLILFFFILVITLNLVKTFDLSFVYSINTIRFYFGFIIFYFFFKQNSTFSFDNIFKYLFILIIIEAILVNNFINAWDLPNYPTYMVNGKVTGHFATEGFNYQRPYSFAAMANVTAPLMIAIFALLKLTKKIHFFLLIILTMVMMSGTGFLALTVLLILKREYFLILLALSCYLIALYFIDNELVNLISSRVGIDQISDLISLKYNQLFSNIIDERMNNESIISLINIFNQFQLHNVLFGGLDILAREQLGSGGDFAWLWVYICFGLISIIFFILLIAININRENFIPIIILIISTFHYPVIFYLSGQIVFAYCLTRRPSIIS